MIKTVNNVLVFGGNSKEALEFYKRVFGAEIIEKVTYDCSRNEFGSSANRIQKSAFLLGNSIFTCIDDSKYKTIASNKISFWLEIAKMSDFDKIYSEFSQAIIPRNILYSNTVYAKVVDPFEVVWELNCEF